MGPQAFSEPETRALKSLLEAKKNVKILLSFHTYSELILYPWGHVYDKIANTAHLQAYQTMANTMAQWNGYTPEQSSDLYIASGDTCDWAYGSLGIFAFTFELSPSSNDWGGGGFYPGAGAIEPTFNANIRPALYLIDLADNPLRSYQKPETTLFYGRR
jgi:carboxypeptidase T